MRTCVRLSKTRNHWIAAIVAVVAVTLAMPSVLGAPREDPREEREELREQRAELAGQLDVLAAGFADIQAALEDLGRNVEAQRARVEDAQRAAADAEAEAEAARAEEQAMLREIAELEDQQTDLLVDAYVREGTSQDTAQVVIEGDPTEDAERRALVDITGNRNEDVADQLGAAQEDLAEVRARANDAAQRAEEHHEQVRARLRELRDAQDQQRALQEEVEQRILAVEDEDAELADRDAELAEEIAELEAQAAAAAPAGVSVTGSGNLCTVGGITVDCSISGNLEAMLNAARADGLVLTGGGYRDPSQQIALRQAHCPDVYNSPPSSCSPPTARPGTSMHEQGLAIDFDNCSYQSSPCFRWLSGNAAGYGFYNLPSEPWHWSVNGR
jgi:hypothetical protein